MKWDWIEFDENDIIDLKNDKSERKDCTEINDQEKWFDNNEIRNRILFQILRI